MTAIFVFSVLAVIAALFVRDAGAGLGAAEQPGNADDQPMTGRRDLSDRQGELLLLVSLIVFAVLFWLIVVG